MSTKVYSRARSRWYKTGFKVIANRRKAELESPEFAEFTEEELIEKEIERKEKEKKGSTKSAPAAAPSKEKAEKAQQKAEAEAKKAAEERAAKIEMRLRKRDRAKWRLGLNLYKCGEFFEAYSLLEYIASGGFIGAKEREQGRVGLLDVRSDVHLYTARCCRELYAITKLHYHLEAGYGHYKNCVEKMGADLSTMFKLPKVLYELAQLLETYGAFQSALELYSKILTRFPMYNGYFDTMYRTSVVGKVLAERMSNFREREEMLNKCIDIHQFLLEAVPPSINEAHLVLMYAKSLEMSSDPSLRFRAPGAYQALHTLCKNARPPIARAATYGNYKEWCEDPLVWIDLANKMSMEEEPLAAKEGFENFSTKVEELKTRGKLLVNVTPEYWLRVAENCTRFQQYDEAVKYAEMGLNINRLHQQCRDFLSKYSKVYQIQFDQEKNAMKLLGSQWLQRCWTKGYTTKYKNLIVQDLEDKFESNRYDTEVRDSLAYYAKDKWRAKFLFENECAFRIQQCFREAKKRWLWQVPIRMKYTEYASSAYRAFMKKPLDVNCRQEVIRVIKHKFCPKKHVIKKLVPILEKQGAAISCIRKSFKAFRLRLSIIMRQVRRRYRKELRKIHAVVLIQRYIRRMRLKQEENERQEEAHRIETASLKVSYFIYRSFQRYRSSPVRMMRLATMKIQAAAQVITICLAYHIRKRIVQRRRYEEYLRKVALEEERLHQVYLQKRYVTDCANIIQKVMFRFVHNQKNLLMKAALKGKALRSSTLSQSSENAMKFIRMDERTFYRSPGVRQNTEQFFQVLQQVVIYCNDSFGSLDCLMLSSLLRHKSCKIQKIIFDSVNATAPTYEFDLLPAISTSKSLKSVSILGGQWAGQFIAKLVRIVEVDNPRINELVLENICSSWSDSVLVSDNIGLLVSDYFNYSVPGLCNLSLHGLHLLDYHIESLAKALHINSSIKYLHLSSNLLENNSLISVFKAVSSNIRSAVILLDFNENLITFCKEARKLLKDYVSPSKLKVLRMILTQNPILEPYDPSVDNFQCLQVITPHSSAELRQSKVSAGSPTTSPAKFKLVKTARKLTRAISAYHGTWMSPSPDLDNG